MTDAATALARDGWTVLPTDLSSDPRVTAWVRAAHDLALRVTADPLMQARWLRHGRTWFAGVDALPNAPDGSVDGVPLAGPWQGLVGQPVAWWHPAQLSVVHPGYPGRDAGESEASHKFRCDRDAAHLDGLLAIGPDKRRFLREPHAFVLGLPLVSAPEGAGPFVVWEGSHRIIRQSFATAFAGTPPALWSDVDLTDVYQATRRRVFDTCPRRTVVAGPGQSIVMHRMAIHGSAPWPRTLPGPAQGRMIAWFRPQLASVQDWMAQD